MDPFEFLGKKETKADVELLTAYMKDETGTVTNPGLKSSIRDTVIATWNVEDLWLRDKTELTQYLVWRYVGTSNGVLEQLQVVWNPKVTTQDRDHGKICGSPVSHEFYRIRFK